MKKIKIFTVTSSGLARKDGISTVILDNFSNFNNNKFEIYLVAAGKCDQLLINQFRTIGVHILYAPSRKKHFFKYLKFLIAEFKKNNFDVLYVNGSSAMLAFELLIAKWSGCKRRVVHSHNTTCEHPLIDRMLRPFFYHSYTRAIACGELAGKWLFEERIFTVIPNGRDFDVYKFDSNKRKTIRSQLGLKKNDFAIGNVGNFVPQKNHEFIIRMMRDLVKKNNFSQLFLFGEGPTKQGILNLTHEYGLDNHIKFMGNVNNIPDMLQAMDVMVLPSLHEGIPLVAVEWQMSSLPSILSNKISQECAYSNLVHFLPIDSNYSEWVNEVLKQKDFKRKSYSRDIAEITMKSTFNIEKSSKLLQKVFEEEVRREY